MKFLIVLSAIAAMAASLSIPRAAPACTSDHFVEGVYVNGTVSMGGDPLTPFDAPMLSEFNTSATEDWSFDSVSADGLSGFGVTVSRGNIVGHVSAQRIIFMAVWPNGTHYMNSFWAHESTVTSCPGKVIGSWYTAGVMNVTFEATEDYKYALVTIDTPEVKGTYAITSMTPPVYPNGMVYPDSRGDPLFAPGMYWVENVPVGTVEVNVTMQGTPMVYSGIGGRERNWNSRPWAEISQSWDMARASVGPFSLLSWRYISNVDNQTYFNMVLMKEGRVIFRTQQFGMQDSEESEHSYATLTHRLDGPVHLSSDPASPNPVTPSTFSGYTFEMVGHGARDKYRFDLDFTQTLYWFPAGKFAHIGGFLGNVTGGQVGGKQYTGLSVGNAQELW